MDDSRRPDGPEILRLSRKRKLRGRLYRIGLAVLVAGGVAGFFVWRARHAETSTVSYVTRAVKQGDLHETVTATGTLKGLDSVNVGAQISGRVNQVFVDFNDQVKEGQILAELDPAQLKSRVDQARSQVLAADASLRLAKATASQATTQAARAKGLADTGILATQELDAARADAERGEANVAAAKAQLDLARASLKDAQTALSYATIRAPIDGIVLSRNVEPGQTVAASFQSPVLFTLARDLTHLSLYVNVDEADVGKVREGQHATFSVDAWPDKEFASKVVSVRNLPTTGESVVTYQAVLSADNAEKQLRPGMTATATITIAEHDGVLLIPNGALRFTPPTNQQQGPRLPFPGMRPAKSAAPAAESAPERGRHAVYTLEAGEPERHDVEIGGTDGEWTELREGLALGSQVVVDMEQKAAQ